MIASIDPDTLPSPVDEADGDAAYAMWVELEDWDFWDLFEAVASADLRTRPSRNACSHPEPTFSLFYLSFQSVLEAKAYSRERAMALYDQLGAIEINHSGNWRGPALPPHSS